MSLSPNFDGGFSFLGEKVEMPIQTTGTKSSFMSKSITDEDSFKVKIRSSIIPSRSIVTRYVPFSRFVFIKTWAVSPTSYLSLSAVRLISSPSLFGV